MGRGHPGTGMRARAPVAGPAPLAGALEPRARPRPARPWPFFSFLRRQLATARPRPGRRAVVAALFRDRTFSATFELPPLRGAFFFSATARDSSPSLSALRRPVPGPSSVPKLALALDLAGELLALELEAGGEGGAIEARTSRGPARALALGRPPARVVAPCRALSGLGSHGRRWGLHLGVEGSATPAIYKMRLGRPKAHDLSAGTG